MTKGKGLPLSGYAILSVFIVSQKLEPIEVGGTNSDDDVQFAWDWRLSGEDLFDVLVKLRVGATKERPSLAEVSLVGRFRRTNPETSVGLAEFAHIQAVAILLPYVRQALANLTVMTERGAYHLPSVNVVALMKDFDVKDGTGAKQLAEQTKPKPSEIAH